MGGVATLSLVDVSDIFYFSSARGRGRGSPRGAEKGEDDFLLKIPGGGGGSRVGGGGETEGPGGCLRGIRGMGAKYFFWGPKGPPSKYFWILGEGLALQFLRL